MEALPRLGQTGCLDTVLDYVLVGEINERGKLGLRLAVNGSVRLRCQRCLGDVELPLRIEAQLEFATGEAEVLAADDDIDRVVASHEMSVAALVEEEVILALPMAPKHEQCRAAAGTERGKEPSAFQALGALKIRNR